MLEETVVIGYGAVPKRDLTGSVSSLKSEDLLKTNPVSVNQGLQGKMAGVNVSQSDGAPGAGINIQIRGANSFTTSTEPLYVVDGMPYSMGEGRTTDYGMKQSNNPLSTISPQDILSIEVLKDASATAIYGSRAANGVILVTTKKGKEGKARIIYNGSVGMSQATELPELAHSYEYAEFYNKAIGTETYTPEMIQKYRDGSDPDNYADEMYLDDLLGGHALQTKHELSVSGGTEKVQYMVSLGYLRQNGLLDNNYYNRYNARVNLGAELAKNLKLQVRLSGMTSDRHEPSTPGSLDIGGFKGIISNAVRFPGLTPTYLQNGEVGLGPKLQGTPVAWVDCASSYREDYDKFKNNIELSYQPIDGLTLKILGGYNYTLSHVRHYRCDMILTGDKSTGPSTLSDEMKRTVYKTFQAVADYNKSFGKHNLAALVGYTWEDEGQRTLSGSRNNFPSDDVPFLGAGGADGQTNGGGGYDWAIQSVFGRLTYNYDQRYLFETTMRYDGSSRFPTDSKYGFFPSLAAGWRISEESFFEPARNIFDNLKVRASYGSLGNQVTDGNFQYLSFLTSESLAYLMNGGIISGLKAPTLASTNITWEKVYTTNIGLDWTMLNGRFTGSFDYYIRDTKGMVVNKTYPAVLGTTGGKENLADMRTKGMELSLTWNDQIKDVAGSPLDYSISIGISDNTSEITKYDNPTLSLDETHYQGKKIGEIWGYVTDGFIKDEAEAQEMANKQAFISTTWKPGDIRYADLNGDGKIDRGNNRVGDSGDKKVIGNTTPRYNFNLNLSGSWKGFDLRLFFQGTMKRDVWLDSPVFWGYKTGIWWANLNDYIIDNSWSETNTNAYYPIPTWSDRSKQTQTKYLQNGAFIRLKDVTLSYTIPKALINKYGIGQLKVFVSGQNLWEATGLYKYLDPDAVGRRDNNGNLKVDDNGSVYPFTRSYSFGINVTF